MLWQTLIPLGVANRTNNVHSYDPWTCLSLQSKKLSKGKLPYHYHEWCRWGSWSHGKNSPCVALLHIQHFTFTFWNGLRSYWLWHWHCLWLWHRWWHLLRCLLRRRCRWDTRSCLLWNTCQTQRVAGGNKKIFDKIQGVWTMEVYPMLLFFKDRITSLQAMNLTNRPSNLHTW